MNDPLSFVLLCAYSQSSLGDNFIDYFYKISSIRWFASIANLTKLWSKATISSLGYFVPKITSMLRPNTLLVVRLKFAFEIMPVPDILIKNKSTSQFNPILDFSVWFFRLIEPNHNSFKQIFFKCFASMMLLNGLYSISAILKIPYFDWLQMHFKQRSHSANYFPMNLARHRVELKSNHKSHINRVIF